MNKFTIFLLSIVLLNACSPSNLRAMQSISQPTNASKISFQTPTIEISKSSTAQKLPPEVNKIDQLISILYASDPALPGYDPQSVAYSQFPLAIEKLSGLGPEAIDAAAHLAHAITYPRPEAAQAAATLISLGPEISATTLPILIDNLSNPSPQVRASSLMVLGSIQKTASCSASSIGPLLWDPDPIVRSAAAYALGSVTGYDLISMEVIFDIDLTISNGIPPDSPEGSITKSARDWWKKEGSKTRWNPTYGLCDA
jgi:hypothetical protein